MFVTWMKTSKGSIPSRTAADLEFPSLTMVSLLSANFPIEKLLVDNSMDKVKKMNIRVQCAEMLDCLIQGGQNIGQMLNDENLAETGGILPKLLRCLNADEYSDLQFRAVKALQACRLTTWASVRSELLQRVVVDVLPEVRGAILEVLLKDLEGDKMEVMYAVTTWCRSKDAAMRLSGAKKCTDLKLFGPANLVLLEEVLEELLGDLVEIRSEALRGMLAGGLSGKYLNTEVEKMSILVTNILTYDSETIVKR